MDAAAGVGRGRPEVEPPDRGRRATRPRHRAQHELLPQPRRPAVDRAADEVGVVRLQLTGAEHPTGEDPRAEARGQPLDPGLHPIGEAFPVIPVPHPSDHTAGVETRLLRDVRVGPQRLGPGGGAGRVCRRHLPGEEEGPLRDRSGRDLVESAGQVAERVGDVHGPRREGGSARPRDRPGQREVDLDRRRVPREPAHAETGQTGEGLLGQQLTVQRRRAHRGDDRAVGDHPSTVRRAHGDGPAPFDIDADHRCAAADLATTRAQSPRQGEGE